ncbi:hypothetical protein Noda2021_01740 [Candidatus Dependentiae bacterium Noda2021]|nr:hypothetical protein Noda2021_01740 [Candidatus Dependentiae bacterium Noda2021]
MLQANNLDWINPDNKIVQTIFYQGILSSQVQAARYMGKEGFVATTGERVICRNGLNLIQNVYIGAEIDEVVPWRAHEFKNSYWKSVKARFHKLISRAANDRDGIEIIPNEQGPSLQAHIIDLKKVNLAQQNDLANHKLKYDLCVQDYPHDSKILFGVSRGAATTFSAIAHNGYDTNLVKLVVLEGCFDSIDHLIKLRVPLLGWYKPTRKMLNKLLYSVFGDYNIHGISPLSLVNEFPHDVPVLFVTSRKDKNVPMESASHLAHTLAATGHPNVYLLVLEQSGHNGYYKDNIEDRYTYLCVLHALYKSLDLPHVPFYAEQGKSLLISCKLSQ